eukprot:CAMPEP_0172457676 /NCGR_PEP_ID=MMETSP1065-20121228/23436_1 /TAXON_ID=265537 /ORGANISM="Amphiprora paludosa, Strain CCMP125" /LENGTH=309 /DNA_ID=CAMNT_0013211539 /DNA_START=373 /DNA_END=1299 /DNA_ORIENTATION=-
MAQGSTNTITSALMLDQLLDVSNTDVLVWEFSINDHWGVLEEKRKKIDFWLKRIHAFFGRTGAKPPSIIFLFLWDFRVRIKLKHIETLDMQPLTYLGALVDSYESLGWDISVVNVGAVINSTIIDQKRHLLLDDGHHPSCVGVKTIARMLFDSIASDISQCPTNFLYHGNQYRHHNIPKTMNVLNEHIGPEWEPLWIDLFQSSSAINTISSWEPHILAPKASSVFNLQHPNLIFLPSKAISRPERKDRKYAFFVPACNESLSISISKRHIKWIGLALTNSQMKPAKTIRIMFNSRELTKTDIQSSTTKW